MVSQTRFVINVNSVGGDMDTARKKHLRKKYRTFHKLMLETHVLWQEFIDAVRSRSNAGKLIELTSKLKNHFSEACNEIKSGIWQYDDQPSTQLIDGTSDSISPCCNYKSDFIDKKDINLDADQVWTFICGSCKKTWKCYIKYQ